MLNSQVYSKRFQNETVVQFLAFFGICTIFCSPCELAPRFASTAQIFTSLLETSQNNRTVSSIVKWTSRKPCEMHFAEETFMSVVIIL